jgi:Fuc2NAc and GlcNAc transferase
MILAVISSIVFLGSFLMSYLIQQHGIKLGLADIPNDRSSHSIPTPKGGGIGIFANFILATVAFSSLGWIQQQWTLSLAVGGMFVFGIGLLDDISPLKPKFRLIVHFIAALWIMTFVVQSLNGIYVIDLGVTKLQGMFLCGIFSLLFIGWMVNLYNFMDGTDGQAGTIGVVVSILLTGFAAWKGHESVVLYLVFSCALLGFLVFNLPPAKIFLGDCGSTFVGFVFGALALLGEFRGGIPLLITVTLLSGFIVDATYTLIARLLSGYRPFEPHRNFGFHRLLARGYSPVQITSSHVFLILIWNAPLAYLEFVRPDLSALWLTLAYAPYTLLGMYLRVGKTLNVAAESPKPVLQTTGELWAIPVRKTIPFEKSTRDKPRPPEIHH